MPSVVLLDANVLVNAPVRDLLLRAAEYGVYRLALSEDIVEEMRRALEQNLGRTRQQTDRLIGEIRRSFEDAFVEGYEPLVASMQNEAGDRHVLAAAVHAGASTIVTFNLKHFPSSALEPHAIEALHPADFLQDLWGYNEPVITRILSEQASDLSGWDVARLLDRLENDVPTFVRAVRKVSAGG